LEAAFVLLEFSSPSRRIFIGSHSLPPSLVRRIGPSASTSRAALPALGAAVSQPEQGLRRPGVSRALLDEAQAKQALWQEFCDHGASLNNAITKAVWLHGGPSFRLFDVSVFCLI
jgi:hypothetical protein